MRRFEGGLEKGLISNLAYMGWYRVCIGLVLRFYEI